MTFMTQAVCLAPLPYERSGLGILSAAYYNRQAYRLKTKVTRNDWSLRLRYFAMRKRNDVQCVNSARYGRISRLAVIIVLVKDE